MKKLPQGLVAGLNAGKVSMGEKPLIVSRETCPIMTP